MSCVWNTQTVWIKQLNCYIHHHKKKSRTAKTAIMCYCLVVEGRSGWLRDQPPTPPPHHKAHPHFGSRPTNYHLCFILDLFQQDVIMNVHCSAFFNISCEPTKLEKKEEEKSYKSNSSSLQSICLLRSIIDWWEAFFYLLNQNAIISIYILKCVYQ